MSIPTDLKHIFNAAYADIFVTRDKKCSHSAREICARKSIYIADDYLGLPT